MGAFLAAIAILAGTVWGFCLLFPTFADDLGRMVGRRRDVGLPQRVPGNALDDTAPGPPPAAGHLERVTDLHPGQVDLFNALAADMPADTHRLAERLRFNRRPGGT